MYSRRASARMSPTSSGLPPSTTACGAAHHLLEPGFTAHTISGRLQGTRETRRTRAAMAGTPAPLTPDQLRARERWQSRWNLPIIVAAVVPLFVNSPQTKWVQVVV